MTATRSIFIDGEAGTTGLEIRQRLAAIEGVRTLAIDPRSRKDAAARHALMDAADLVVLCLPDAAAKEAVALADELGEKAPRILDASTAHRVAEGWTYGFPELSPEQSHAIKTASRVANPGCYPTGAIALIRPLVDAGLVPADYPIVIGAVSGYSGGGRAMIESYESGEAPSFEIYGLGFDHKHIPELTRYAKLTRRPIFVPSVGNFRQGMLVGVALHLDTLPGKPSAHDLEDALAARYQSAASVRVVATASETRISAEDLNGTDLMELRVFGEDSRKQALLVARLDNLGKGASGAAVQNIKLMLGL